MKHTAARVTALLFVASSIASCTSPEPLAYSGIESSAKLRTNMADRSGRVPLRYRDASVDFGRYRQVIVEPVVIYRGGDAQFGKMTEADRLQLTAFMQQQFTEKLRTRFSIVGSPTPETLRLRITLTGARSTTAVLGPASRLDIMGGAINSVQAVRGREGTMTGSVNYAVEVFDASEGRLLLAYVAQQYPNAMNVGASFRAMVAAEVGIRKGADDLIRQLN